MKRKHIFLLLLCAVIGSALAFFLLRNKKPLIVFYDLPDDTVYAFQAALREQCADIEKTFNWEILDNTAVLQDFLEHNRHTAFIFSPDQRCLFEVKHLLTVPDMAVFDQVPSTFRNNFFAEESDSNLPYAFPLLADPVKVVYDTELFHRRAIAPYNSLQDFERILTVDHMSNEFPFVTAGGSDEQLFAFVAAVMAILDADIKPQEFADLGKTADLHGSCPAALKLSLNKLCTWRQQGALHPEWFRLIDRDIAVFMEFKNALFAALPLSASRRFDGRLSNQLTSRQLPVQQNLNGRNLPAKLIVCAQTQQTADNPTVKKIRDCLYTQAMNELLAQKTGLAPVFSAAKTQDSEASAGRYWAASSNRIIPFLGDIACRTAAEKQQLAQALRRYLEVDGIGY